MDGLGWWDGRGQCIHLQFVLTHHILLGFGSGGGL